LDVFHDLILTDELARCGSGGLLFACFFSFAIALPPVLAYGSQYLKDLVARDVITGKKIMALAITEPWGGSDVAAVRTVAVRQGDHYVLSGEKKFITSGNKADWFTVAARTAANSSGAAGISLFLVDAHSPGITVRRLKTQGWWVSGTTYIVFDEVRVPASHLIGKENQGFGYVMKNFNHERYAPLSASLTCATDSLEWPWERGWRACVSRTPSSTHASAKPSGRS
jgi:acyl-CoA dehydrogenase